MFHQVQNIHGGFLKLPEVPGECVVDSRISKVYCGMLNTPFLPLASMLDCSLAAEHW